MTSNRLKPGEPVHRSVSSMRGRQHYAVEVLAFVGIFMSTTALLPAVSPGSQDHPVGIVQKGWMWPTYYALLLIALAVIRKQYPINRYLLVVVTIPVIYFMASMVWSDTPNLVMQRAGMLAATVLFGYFLATRVGLVKTISMISTVIFVVTLLSVAAYVLFGQRAIDPVTDGLRGVLVQKNLLGRLIALGFVVDFCCVISSRIFPPISFNKSTYGPVCRIVIYMLVLPWVGSTTAYIVASIVCVLVLISAAANRWRLGLIAGPCCILGGLVIYREIADGTILDILFSASGKDSTFSNRTLIWRAVDYEISLKPNLGYGYGAFWTGAYGPGGDVNRELGTTLGHAHSGYREILLQGGAIGLFVVCICLCTVLVNLFYRSIIQGRFADAPRLVLFVFPLAYSIVESNTYTYNSIYTIILVVGACGSGITTRSVAEYVQAQNSRYDAATV